jgi:hypothetical protein
MTDTFSGYYALIQFCPDLARLELANVGIAIISPAQNCSVVLSGRSDLANALIENSALREAGATLAIEGFVERLRETLSEEPTLSALREFTPLGANPVSLSKVRELTIREIKSDAKRLFYRLVL